MDAHLLERCERGKPCLHASRGAAQLRCCRTPGINPRPADAVDGGVRGRGSPRGQRRRALPLEPDRLAQRETAAML